MFSKNQNITSRQQKESGYLSAFCTKGLMRYLEKQGSLGQKALSEADVISISPEDPARTAPYTMYRTLLDAAEEHLKDPMVNIRAVKGSDVESWGIAFYAVVSQPTMVEVMDRCRDLTNTSTSMIHLTLKKQEHGFALRFEPTSESFDDYERLTEMLITIFLCVLERGLNQTHVPVEVRLQHGPRAACTIYDEVMGVPVKFDAPHTEIFMPNSVVDAPTKRPDENLAKLMSEQMHQSFYVPIITDNISRQVVVQLERARNPDQWKLENIAENLGISPRTLQNRLARQGRLFKGVVDEVRKDKADLLLRSPKRMEDVALLLGYTDVSGFVRAFRRWFGVTPGQWRESMNHPVQAPAGTDSNGKADTP